MRKPRHIIGITACTLAEGADDQSPLPPAAIDKVHQMTTFPHPVTGVPLNSIELAHGRITEAERQTAHLLLAEGHARWVVAAMLGRFPLAFDGTGRPPGDTRRRRGGNLSDRAARQDPRQRDIFEDFFDDLFGRSPAP